MQTNQQLVCISDYVAFMRDSKQKHMFMHTSISEKPLRITIANNRVVITEQVKADKWLEIASRPLADYI